MVKVSELDPEIERPTGRLVQKADHESKPPGQSL